ncbi:MAG TPA: hypothetical protein VKA01_17565 [Vicinamibacteria bacterium]|nr:hypothetical protein [Vicinamibacteria bacterium]
MTVRVPLAALGLVLLLWAAPAIAQCPMCKTALTQSAEGQRIASDFNRAILVMVAAPYLIFGTIAGFVFRSRIREWLATARWSSSRS